MNAAHWHLVVNHFPVVLPLIGLPVAVYGAACKKASLQQLGLGLLVFAAVFTVVAYLTGGPAADILKKDPSIDPAFIKTHGLAAEWALRSAGLVGVFSAVLWVRSIVGRPLGKVLWIAHMVVTLWGISVVAVTANHGGNIRHSEIRPAAPKAADAVPETPQP